MRNKNIKKKNTKIKKKLKIKFRFIFILFLICSIFIGLVGRLFYLMIVMSPKFKALAVEQQRSEITINAKRGRILDRNGNELAISGSLYQIDLDLKTLRQTLSDENMTFDELSGKLAPILNMKETDITKIFNTTLPNGLPASYAVLKRQVEQSQMEKVKALKILGIVISSDTKRYYTNAGFLSSVLGYINSDGKGISGVELMYNKDLSGTPGTYAYERDMKNNALPENSQYNKPIDGKDVVLTIDEVIQQYAETAAQKALDDNKAKAVNILVMNPKTGEILAMANKSADESGSTSAGTSSSQPVQMLWRNASVQDTFEPGSIFKVITAACALESNIGINDTYVDNGSISVNKVPIHCWYLPGHGTETFVDIIKNSCNVGFVQLGQKLGKDKLVDFAHKMGFGQKTGIDLPGEPAGILRNANKINNVDLASMSFGQGFAVTQVQYMAAFNAIANGGTWIKPHVMKNIAHLDSNENLVVDSSFSDFNKKNIYGTDLSANLRQDLLKVVTEGVGANAFVQGLDIAGKTGTAQVADPATGRYAPGKYMSSFAGMAPVNDPKITLLVSVNQPGGQNYYAGEISAPVAKELFQKIFDYLAFKGENNILGN